ncbi:FHA domain-containing protein [Nocardia salmonicida]|uniref:FHA domain-containing protein n=1 Tax=Nocardia salmonicida TaxID=53431 RepID=UPI00372260B1
MADVTPDIVRCGCGSDWDRMAYAQCRDCGEDLWEITVVAPPPPPPPEGEQQSTTPGTRVDPVSPATGPIELTACGVRHPLQDGNQLALGRDEDYPTATTFRDYTNVSRYHAVLRYQSGRLYVTDTESTNGTFINGTKIAARTEYEIRPGQQLRLGADVPIAVHWP